MAAEGRSHDTRTGAAVAWYLSISSRAEGESVVVSAVGRLGCIAAPELTEALRTAGDKGRHVVLDLADVDYISSAGIHAIETAAARLHARTQSLTVRGAHGVTKLSLDLAGALANVSCPG